MKKRCIRFLFLIHLLVFTMAFVPIERVENVFVVDYNLSLDERNVKDQLDHDLLSYHDVTYMAVRDVAKLFHRDVLWHEDTNGITLLEQLPQKTLFQKEETALKIGKAIIEENFSEQINETTRYQVLNVTIGRNTCFEVYVLFDGTTLLDGWEVHELADAKVIIDHQRWAVCGIQMWNDEESAWVSWESK